MSETTVTIIVAVITALGSVITALIGWLARRGVNYLDQKTKILDEANKIQKKEAMKQRIIDVVTLVARSTMQTYVDELKEKSADGKLTKEEAREAFRRTFDKALSILKEDGIEVTKDMLTVIVEAVVGKLKLEKNSLRGEKA
jgi:predicted RNA-binding protein associated with RNAse of E/G family